MKRFYTLRNWCCRAFVCTVLFLLSALLTSCSCPVPPPPPPAIVTLEDLRNFYIHILQQHNILVVTLGETQRIVLPEESIFAPYSANLLGDQETRLDTVIKLMRTYWIENVSIHAFTDNQFPANMEHEISINQAHAVTDYLWRNESDMRFVIAQGYGDSNLVASNDTEEGRYYNRRVEITYRIYPPEILY